MSATAADTDGLDRLEAAIIDPSSTDIERLLQAARWYVCGGRNLARGDVRVHKAAFKLYKVRLREAIRG